MSAMEVLTEQPSSNLRRISEDKHLRQFLSAHFNSSEYVADIIRQGKSEEIFLEISKSMEDVKEEIQLYITQNKGHLMGGMQGVAALAERYSMLSITSQKLNRSVEKLKREALASHDLVSSRTRELERIHQAGALLRQVRQFAHAHGQLEHLMTALKGNKKTTSGGGEALHIQSGSDVLALDDSVDIRQMSTVAKLVNELEGLLEVEELHDVEYLRSRKDRVVTFGRDLRRATAARLLQALKDSDQASAASCLQIFFNLGALAHTLVTAIDTVVAHTVESGRSRIDVDELGAQFPELLGGASSGRGGKGGSRGAAALAVVASMGTKGGSKRTSDTRNGREGRAQSEVMLRAALKETATMWSEDVRDLAKRVMVLQRVLTKKEDPGTHVKFTSHVATKVASGACDGLSRSRRELHLLGAGDLLSLFFARLQAPFGEMVLDKAKRAPNAVIRLYPYLRSAAVDVVGRASSSITTESSSFSSSSSSLDSSSYSSRHPNPTSAFGALDIGSSSSDYFSVGAVLGSSTEGPLQATSASKRAGAGVGYEEAVLPGARRRQGSVTSLEDSGVGTAAVETRAPATSGSGDDDLALVLALAPMKERYLASCLAKVTSPINQMFPELEGYTAAVPSKRDVQELLKAITTELVAAAADGGISLLRVVSVECMKAVQLIVTKVRGMAITASSDTTLLELILVDGAGNRSTVRAADGKGGGDLHAGKWKASRNSSSTAPRDFRSSSFLRNSAQDHNIQLVSLLAQLRDSLASLPSTVAAAVIGASSAKSEGEGEGEGEAAKKAKAIEADISSKVVRPAHAAIDKLVTSSLVAPIVHMVSSYTKSVLFQLPAEGSSGPPEARNDAALSSSGDADEALLQGCSSSVTRAIQELPALLSTYFSILPRATSVGGAAKATPQKREEQRHFPATAWAIEQLCLHIMAAYISSAALVRPINEAWRLRTAKELSALEHTMSTATGLNINSDLNQGDVEACPVYQEFRAFRRFIFREEESAVSASVLSPQGKGPEPTPPSPSPSPNPKIGMTAPSLEDMLVLPYYKYLRPSTVLAYISSCSPSQMPSPYEADGETKTVMNVHTYLTQLTSISTDAAGEEVDSVRKLYKSGYLVKDRRGALVVATTWKVIEQEMASWSSFQSSLDKFLQRISVAEPAKRVGMRGWADSLLNIGNYYFGGR